MTVDKKKRVRSPNYPFIPLGEAIEFARLLYKNQKQYSVALDIAAKDWDFRSAKTSYMSQHVAALSSYGLIDVEGGGSAKKIKISTLAFNILIDDRPQSETREKLIKEAALKPPIFKKIYDAYPSELPVEHTLDYELKTTYKFNPDSVMDVIKILRKTFDFAKVYKSGIIEKKDESTEDTDMDNADTIPLKPLEENGKGKNPPTGQPNTSKFGDFPIGENQNAIVTIYGTDPITWHSIQNLIASLQLAKKSKWPNAEAKHEKEGK